MDSRSNNGLGATIGSTNSNQILIRPVQAADTGAVKNLILQILGSEYAEDQQAYPAEDLEDPCQAYGADGDLFLVAEDQGKIVGTCAIKRDEQDVALMRRLFVDSGCRGKGVGSQLVDRALEHCKSSGAKRVQIRTADRMAAAIELCKKKGFEEEDRFTWESSTLVLLKLQLDS